MVKHLSKELNFPKNSGRGVMVKSLVQTEQGSDSPVQNISVLDYKTLRCIQTGSHEPRNGFCIARGERVLSSMLQKMIPSVFDYRPRHITSALLDGAQLLSSSFPFGSSNR